MPFTTRPVIMGTHGVVTSGHYLATMAGVRMLEKGGNAIDAGVAAGFCLNVLEPQSNGIGGEVPILIYSAKDKRAFAINGQGWAPKAATIEWFKQNQIDLIPGNGFLPATAPAAADSWITALAHFGKLSLADVIEPAIELTEKGFPMYSGLRGSIQANAEKFMNEWPSSAKVYLPNGKVPQVGEIFVQRDWAKTFKKLIEVEHKEKKRGRKEALTAARDFFYKGEIAETIAKFAAQSEVLDNSGKKNRGLLSYDDLAEYQAKVEEAISVDYRGYTVYKCNTWCQGAVFLQQLTLLEGYNLVKLGHNSADYIHTVIEAAKLAFADRERFYGDPEFVKVPLDRLLSKDYAAQRRQLIDPNKASLELRPGDGQPIQVKFDPSREGTHTHVSDIHVGDTTHLDAIDSEGNMISATPSGGWFPSSPVVEGLGFPLGTRGQMFYLDYSHANSLVPHKRPRTTLTPSLALKDGEPFMVFGTPGGDCQDQWTLQFFLNYIDFGMNLQEAIDAPTFHTQHFPSSFYPHSAFPGRIVVEGRIPESARAVLVERGHDLRVGGDWSHGKVLAIRFEPKTGVVAGAASPRGEIGYAIGW